MRREERERMKEGECREEEDRTVEYFRRLEDFRILVHLWQGAPSHDSLLYRKHRATRWG